VILLVVFAVWVFLIITRMIGMRLVSAIFFFGLFDSFGEIDAT